MARFYPSGVSGRVVAGLIITSLAFLGYMFPEVVPILSTPSPKAMLEVSGGPNVRWPCDGNQVRFYYRLRHDGFNAQAYTAVFAVEMAYAFNATLALPEMLEDFQYHHRNESNHHPFEDYFDMQAVSRIIEAVPMRSYIDWCHHPGRSIIPLVAAVEDLQLQVMEVELGLQKTLGQPIYFGYYDGWERLSQIFRDAAPGSCFAILSTFPSPSFLDYGQTLQYGSGKALVGFHNATGSEYKRAILEALLPKSQYFELARASLGRLKCHTSLSMHFRLGDYKTSHCLHGDDLGPKTEVCPDEEESCQYLVHTTQVLPGNVSIIVFAPPEDLANVRDQVALCVAKDLGNKVCEVVTSHEVLEVDESMRVKIENRPDVFGSIEQSIASMTTQFIGNRFSSWSGKIFTMRELSHIGFKYWTNITFRE